MPADHEEGAGMTAGHPQAAPVTVQVHHTQGGGAVCRVAGDLDIEGLAPAEESLTGLVRQAPPVLVVDLEEVGFCDSSGLNLLLRTRAAAQEAGVRFRLAAVAPTVMRVLELTGAQTVFSLHESVDAALSA
ncbi:STAS domain-containing protein [Streptomyces antimicrobicus]|uniref:Anti-sigma factor antagonist n=1 Tax=Streptomyces antimicrobicus TaxID=2883108 RepID=A0ABS8B7W4_9ACTN|nr:STAS domain-containing protein [Streptomyces antimicrobicus]MCB5180667.1 STAS domain-containing protein [Streptomyces antimicrobicus]